jgi:hypothetical protein
MPGQNWIHVSTPGARRVPAGRFLLEATDLLEQGHSPESVQARMVERGFTPEDAAELVGGLFVQEQYDHAVDLLNGGMAPDEVARHLAAAKGLDGQHAADVIANLLARPSWRRSSSSNFWDRVGGVLFVVGLVAVVAGGWLAYALWDEATERGRLRELNEHNRWTQGRLTEVTKGSSYSDHVETVTFVYSVEGKEYHGKEGRWVWGEPARVGAPIQVLYHPERPALHRTRKVPDDELAFSWGRIVANKVFPACVVLLAVAIVGAVKTAMRGAAAPPPDRLTSAAPSVHTGHTEGRTDGGDAARSAPPLPPASPTAATVALGRYVFEQQPGRLMIRYRFGFHVGSLIIGSVLGCGGVAGSVALVVALGPTWWLLATGAAAGLGGWLFSRTLVLGRTVWTLDRAADTFCHRDRVLRPLSSIERVTAHLVAIYDHARGQYTLRTYSIGFAPDFGKPTETMEDCGILTTILGMYRDLWQKDVIVIPKAKEAAQAAALLGAFLGVEVECQGLE